MQVSTEWVMSISLYKAANLVIRLKCCSCVCSCVCVGFIFQVCFLHLLMLSCGVVKVDTVSFFSVLFYFLRRWLSFGVIVFLHLKRSCYSLSLLLFIFRYFICCLQKKFQFNIKVRDDSFSAFRLNIRLYSCLVFHNSRKNFFDCCWCSSSVWNAYRVNKKPC